VFRPHRPTAFPVVLSFGLLLALVPTAAAVSSPPYQHIGTVTEPNSSLNDGFGSFDISFIDVAHDIYYLADRGGCASNMGMTPTSGVCSGPFINGRIDVVDADDGSLIGYIGPDKFAGNYNNPLSGVAACAEKPRDPRSGPNGVLADDKGLVWVGDGNVATGPCGSGANGSFSSGSSSIKLFDPNGTLLAAIDNGGNRRADELAFGRLSTGGGRLLISNPEEVKPSFPFATLIDTDHRTMMGKILFDKTPPAGTPHDALPPVGHGWDSSLQDTGGNGGLEQDVWDPNSGNFLLNVPATTLNPGGEIDVVRPHASNFQGSIVQVIPLDSCGGSGLALDGEMLIVQCGGDIRVLQEDTGAEIARFNEGGGADEIWFNPGDGNVYQGIIGPPVTPQAGIGILHMPTLTYLGIVPVPAGLGTHSVAAGGNNNRIFFPMAEGSIAAHNAGNGGIGMFQHDDSDPPIH
jgi:hypothetical protein